jgi:hypothetical protein
MPRYHFHIVNGHEVFDSQGKPLPNEGAAREYAEMVAKQFAKMPIRTRLHAVRVTNETGDVLFRIPIDKVSKHN